MRIAVCAVALGWIPRCNTLWTWGSNEFPLVTPASLNLTTETLNRQTLSAKTHYQPRFCLSQQRTSVFSAKNKTLATPLHLAALMGSTSKGHTVRVKYLQGSYGMATSMSTANPVRAAWVLSYSISHQRPGREARQGPISARSQN